MNNAGKYFDDNVGYYSGGKTNFGDVFFTNHLKETKTHIPNVKLLDIGGGDGIFSIFIKSMFPDISVTVLDPSQKMLDTIKDNDIHKVCGGLPLKVFSDTKFNYIHIKNVLHHITGKSVNESKNLLVESLYTIRSFLDDGGIVFLHDLFYESYFIPSFSRCLIFYLLKMQNMARIKVPTRDFLKDLDVCFYTRNEFKNIIISCGFNIIDYYEFPWKGKYIKNKMIKKTLALLKNCGEMLFVVNCR